MNKDEFLRLVDKYLAGEATPTEEQWLFNYFNSFQHPAAWNETDLGPTRATEQKLLQRLRAAMHARNARKSPLARLRRPLAAAAILIIIAGSFFLFKSMWQPSVLLQEVVTHNRERRQVQLADGTQVWLEPGSRLQYPARFTGDTREIQLSGSAFFEVAGAAEHPFIIHTGTLNTRVLGTSFHVKAYNLSRQEVAVVTGRVMVRPEGEEAADTASLILAHSQKAAWNASRRRLEKSTLTNAAGYAQRRFGKFIYEGEPLAAVADDIQQQYGVALHLDGTLHACTFYGDFDVREGLEKVLHTIAITLNARVVRENGGQAYRITGGGCPPAL